MFPKDSAFSRSEEQEAHLKRVRESALSPLPDGDEGHGIRDQIRKEAEEIIERYELDREQLRDKMDH